MKWCLVFVATILVLGVALAAEEVKEKVAVVQAEAQPAEEHSQEAQDRSDHDDEDQIALESGHVEDHNPGYGGHVIAHPPPAYGGEPAHPPPPPVYHAPVPQAYPQQPIPVPLPVPVKPNSVVLPTLPKPPAPQYNRPPPRPQPQAYHAPPRPANPGYQAGPAPAPSVQVPAYQPAPPAQQPPAHYEQPAPLPQPAYQQGPAPAPQPAYQPGPAPAPAPQPAYQPGPAPAPQPNYQQGPPPQPAYQQGPPPPPPAQNYQGPPPPAPQPAYQGPAPAPAPAPQPGYQGPAPAPQPAYQGPAPAPQPAYQGPAPAPAPLPAPQPVSYAKQAPPAEYQTGPAAAASYQSTAVAQAEQWLAPTPEMPKIASLDVKCEKNLMKVYIEFDKPFYGIIFSKGHYSNVNCVHLPAGLGRTSANFDISINTCGTTGNTENGLYGYGAQSGSGTFFENTMIVQYDPQVQEVWDQARKLRCTWHDQYEKSVTFRPFPVDMLDVVRADFAGDNVGCWMQIQVGKGPWASEVSGLVKIGQTMTMVLAIKDDDNKFDMLVRNCMAHDGKRAPIQLVDQRGCVTRPKLMSRFTKIKNFGASASVLSYAHFQAFKFPDSMEVHFQCTIQICRYQCPDQCASEGPQQPGYGIEPRPAGGANYAAERVGRPRDERRTKRDVSLDQETDVGINRIIQVVSTGDLTFALEQTKDNTTTIVFPSRENDGLICMTSPGFAATLVVLLAILVISCLLSAFLCIRHRSLGGMDRSLVSYENPVFGHKKGHF